MSRELAPIKTEVQRPVIGDSNPLVGMAYATVFSMGEQARRIHWKTWLIGGSFAAAMVLYMTQWQKPAPPASLSNPYDARSIPAFDEAKLLEKDLEAIDQQERNLSAFLNEERQRKTIALAFGFRALATFYIQSPNHACNGLSEMQCLATFDDNRISGLEGLGDRKVKTKEFSPMSVLKPVLDQSSELDRVEGLRLAKILAKPANTRAGWEQWEVDMRYPLLNSGIPADELRPRPMLLAKLLKQSQASSQQMSGTSQEAQARLEHCLSLPPEQQEARGGCS